MNVTQFASLIQHALLLDKNYSGGLTIISNELIRLLRNPDVLQAKMGDIAACLAQSIRAANKAADPTGPLASRHGADIPIPGDRAAWLGDIAKDFRNLPVDSSQMLLGFGLLFDSLTALKQMPDQSLYFTQSRNLARDVSFHIRSNP